MNLQRKVGTRLVGFGLLAAVAVGCAKTSNESAPQAPAAQTQQAPALEAQNAQVFAITKDSELKSVDGKSLALPAGTEVTVLRKSQTPDMGEVAEVRIDSDDLSVPTEALIRASDLSAVSMPTGQGLTDLDAALSGIDDEQVLVENAGRHGGTPSCYRDVKFELLRRGLVNSYPPGAAAWMGYDVLRKQYGFRPVGFSQNLPDGAVCISDGGRFNCGGRSCGHIAVKIGYKRWYGAGVFPHPLLRRHYNLRCVVK